jgi:benzodiazapine receptor
MKPNLFIKIIVALAVTFAAPVLASVFTRQAISEWYVHLNKPFFTPPGWIFGPVWTALYVLMAVAAAMVWNKGMTASIVKIALALYLIQLILNGLWTPIFFGAKMPLLAFIEIVFLWAAVFLTILTFARVSKTAAALLIPYLLWTSFAAVLNFSIWYLNR